MKKSVLLLETIAEEALEVLRKHTHVFAGYDEATLKEVLNKEKIEAVITRGKGRINKALMEACPALKIAARCGVGLDNVDLVECAARNILVINAPGSNAATIAEHTLALMLMLRRNMYESVARVKANNWNWRNGYTGDEINGKTLGILGMGDIGKRVGGLAEAFGMKVMYWSRSIQDTPYPYFMFDEVLKQSDIISLHLPLTKETAAIIGKVQLALMKPGAMLINTARGALIDHDALLDALNTNQVAGFAADVLPEEPPVFGSAIIMHPHTLVTPHSGSLTASTFQQMCMITIQKLVEVLG